MGELVATAEARPERRPIRDAFNGWFVTHEVAWELAMAALAVIYVALGFLVDEVDAGKRPEIEAVELVLTGLFVLEFGSRILAARSRLAYLRGHWSPNPRFAGGRHRRPQGVRAAGVSGDGWGSG